MSSRAAAPDPAGLSATRPAAAPSIEFRLTNSFTHTYQPRQENGLLANEQSLAVYALGDETVINTWQAAVFCWPEILGVLSLLLALLSIRPLRRAIRRQRLVGEPYCRRCLYQLRGCESSRCPECGIDITSRNKLAGTPCRLRIAALITLLVLLPAAYPSILLMGPQRHPAIARRYEWFSSTLHDFAHARKIQWLINLDLDVRRLDRLDQQGRARLFARVRAGGPRWPSFSHDSNALSFIRDNQIHILSSATGRHIQSYSAPKGATLWTSFYSGDGKILYAIDSESRLHRWDTASQHFLDPILFPSSLRHLQYTALCKPPGGGLVVVFGKREVITVRPDGTPQRSFSFPHGVIFDGKCNDLRSFYLTWQSTSNATPKHGGDIQVWDLAEGRCAKSFQRPHPARFIAPTADGKLLYHFTVDDDWGTYVEALNAHTGQAIAQIHLGRDTVLPCGMALSKDERRLAVFSNMQDATPVIERVHFIDLIRTDSPSAPPATQPQMSTPSR